MPQESAAREAAAPQYSKAGCFVVVNPQTFLGPSMQPACSIEATGTTGAPQSAPGAPTGRGLGGGGELAGQHR